MDLMNLSDKDMDKIIKNTDKEIHVVVGEGDIGNRKKYAGSRTIKAIKKRLEKEIEGLKAEILSYKVVYDWDDFDIFMQIEIGYDEYSYDWSKETWWLQ